MVRNRTGRGSVYAGDTSPEAVEKRLKRLDKKGKQRYQTEQARKDKRKKRLRQRAKKGNLGVPEPVKPKFLNEDGTIDYNYHSF